MKEARTEKTRALDGNLMRARGDGDMSRDQSSSRLDKGQPEYHGLKRRSRGAYSARLWRAYIPTLREVARRVVWFKQPDEALASPLHFLGHVMTYGTPEDLRAVYEVVLREFADDHPRGGALSPRPHDQKCC